jgi:hypothetical protein
MNGTGSETIVMDVLEYYTDIYLVDIKLRERAVIASLRADGFDLLNGTTGGQGAPGAVRSEAVRKKISEAMTGRAAHNKGKPMSEAQKELLRKSVSGFKHSDEAKIKMSRHALGNANSKGYKQSPEHIAKRLETIRRNKELAEAEVQNEVSLTS